MISRSPLARRLPIPAAPETVSAAETWREKANVALKRTERWLQKHPATVLVIGFAAGVALGWVIKAR